MRASAASARIAIEADEDVPARRRRSRSTLSCRAASRTARRRCTPPSARPPESVRTACAWHEQRGEVEVALRRRAAPTPAARRSSRPALCSRARVRGCSGSTTSSSHREQQVDQRREPLRDRPRCRRGGRWPARTAGLERRGVRPRSRAPAAGRAARCRPSRRRRARPRPRRPRGAGCPTAVCDGHSSRSPHGR